MGRRLLATRMMSKKCLFFVLIVGTILILFLTQIALQSFGKEPAPPPSLQSTQDIGKELVINTTTCKIPKFPAWSSEARQLLPTKCGAFFLGDPKCGEKHIHAWSYLKDSVSNNN